MVPRHSKQARAEAFFSLSQTERRLSHRYARWALEAELQGNRAGYIYYTKEQRRLWRAAWFHFDHARLEYKGL